MEVSILDQIISTGLFANKSSKREIQPLIAHKQETFILTGLHQYWVKPAIEKEETHHWIKAASQTELKIAGARYMVLYKIL